MVVTICPPGGTNASNITVLAHIPDAIITVDSAPSSALFQRERRTSLKIGSNGFYQQKSIRMECKPYLLLQNHRCWISITPIFKTCPAFLLSKVQRHILFISKWIMRCSNGFLFSRTHTLKSMSSAVFLKK